MAFEDDITRHAEQIKTRLPFIKGEEAAKQSLVVPFLQVLGYDVWDPREVQPEYIADFAKKKSNGQMEKIDYALHIGSAPGIFIECKAADKELDEHDAQLARYFNATPSVRVAVLTNGVRLKIFTDLQQPNIMDDKPWLDVDLRNVRQAEIDALKRLRKADFDAEQVVSLAEEMVYYNVMVAFMAAQLRDPSEAFVRFIAGEIPTIGRITSKIVERLTPIIRKAIQASIVAHVERSFSREPEPLPEPVAAPPPPPVTMGETREGVVTTVEELECFSLISTMIKEVHPDAIVSYRDSKSYFTIIQKNVRKWFVRLGVERQPYWVAFRHVRVEDAKRLCPGMDVIDGSQFGDCRFTIKTIADLNKLRSVILASYNAEAARVAEETELVEAVAVGGGGLNDARPPH
ncbi:type I restriction endonuclease [soil metagenome]